MTTTDPAIAEYAATSRMVAAEQMLWGFDLWRVRIGQAKAVEIGTPGGRLAHCTCGSAPYHHFHWIVDADNNQPAPPRIELWERKRNLRRTRAL